jgi:dihydroorotate dehydrogenase
MASSDPLPTYRIDKTYQWNYDHAPDPVEIDIPPIPGPHKLCGLPVTAPFGIAAGPLLNGKWIRYYASLGYPILTYKTVRTTKRACYKLPNLVNVREPRVDGDTVNVTNADAADSWAISFGMPSMSPEVWRADVADTRNALQPGQLLIVSVVGTAEPGAAPQDLADDYARCAKWAGDAGAHLIEANFSCPNVDTADGMIYKLPDQAKHIAQTLRAAVPGKPLILKTGYIDHPDLLKAFILAVAEHADALCMVNAVAAHVRRPDGTHLFDGQIRGIGGPAVKDACLAQVRAAHQIIQNQNLPLQLLGVGGAATYADVREFLDAGAAAVQMATAPMKDPLTALTIRRQWE